MVQRVRDLFRVERLCEECGEALWGSERQRFCKPACQQRARRAERTRPFKTGRDLVTLCGAVLERAKEHAAGAPAAKLLPRLFRAVARELRARGWDPIELLMTSPEDPASEDDVAPGGILGTRPHRRKWLYPPEAELEKLAAIIAKREEQGHSVVWHVERMDQIREYLILRNAEDRAAAPAQKT
jgi:hypothetical protein